MLRVYSARNRTLQVPANPSTVTQSRTKQSTDIQNILDGRRMFSEIEFELWEK